MSTTLTSRVWDAILHMCEKTACPHVRMSINHNYLRCPNLSVSERERLRERSEREPDDLRPDDLRVRQDCDCPVADCPVADCIRSRLIFVRKATTRARSSASLFAATCSTASFLLYSAMRSLGCSRSGTGAVFVHSSVTPPQHPSRSVPSSLRFR